MDTIEITRKGRVLPVTISVAEWTPRVGEYYGDGATLLGRRGYVADVLAEWTPKDWLGPMYEDKQDGAAIWQEHLAFAMVLLVLPEDVGKIYASDMTKEEIKENGEVDYVPYKPECVREYGADKRKKLEADLQEVYDAADGLRDGLEDVVQMVRNGREYLCDAWPVDAWQAYIEDRLRILRDAVEAFDGKVSGRLGWKSDIWWPERKEEAR